MSYRKRKQLIIFIFPVCLPDSVLAFHKHGMQGRSFKNGEVTQEISDPSRTYRLLGSDKYVSNNYKRSHVNLIEVLKKV